MATVINPTALGKYAGAYLGRNTGPQQYAQVPHDGTAQQVIVNRNIPLNLPLYALWVRWQGRITIGTANFSAAWAESPQTLINQIQIQGTYKGNNLTPIKLSGATAFAWMRCFQARGNSSYINGTRQPEPSVPFAQALATIGNTGTYDLDIWYCIPTWPVISLSSRARTLAPYFWQGADWGNSMVVTLNLNDKTALGTPGGGTTVAFTAFGSGTGTPTVSLYTDYALLGVMKTGFRTAAVVRGENLVTGGMSALGQNVQLAQLQNQKTANVLIKSGVLATGTTSGVQCFASLSDTQLDLTQLLVNNQNVRPTPANLVAKEFIGLQFATVEPQGYLPFSFIDSQNPRSAYRADLPQVVGSGGLFQVVSSIITANANQAISYTQEMIFADVNDPDWADTQ